ncbi:hypothetical protein AT864_01615 [Anoxybacillus sp. P3H1B]|uniref:hypothetical protein n=1 Tax=Anoxybacillus sp. P3H1B TaxID=1769293 RepID=UPI0007942377|nr:hypothetical protein [Anoxybacillus sp. P3H1B]KXG10054.1 hypothetical protein AT864_01615 [Anoxybacillus sp. P3H1B]
MLDMLEQAIRATFVTWQLAEQLLEKLCDEQWQSWLTSYIAKEQKQHEIWKYLFMVSRGIPYERALNDKGQAVQHVEEMVAALFFREIEKNMLYYRMYTQLAKAPKYAAEQALTHSLEHSRCFFQWMQKEREQAQLI